jgi:hypothetical protein
MVLKKMKTVKQFKDLASAILLTIGAGLLTAMELAVSYFPSLSLSGETPQVQEIKPDFYS